MTLKILTDAKNHPEHFYWFGTIERSPVESWMKAIGIQVPEDVLLFWSETGGGDCFMEGDDFETANHFRRERGMNPEFLAFHDGLKFVSSPTN